MEDYLGTVVVKQADQAGQVSDVTVYVPDEIADPGDLEIAGTVRGWRQRVTGDIGAELGEPEAKPGSLETAVAGDEHPASAEVALELRHADARGGDHGATRSWRPAQWKAIPGDAMPVDAQLREQDPGCLQASSKRQPHRPIATPVPRPAHRTRKCRR